MRTKLLVISCFLLLSGGCKIGSVQDQRPSVGGQISSPASSPVVPSPSISQSTPTTPQQSDATLANGPAAMNGLPNGTARGRSDVCAMITSAEIKSVLGDKVGEAKSTAMNAEGVSVSQCYYVLPRSGNSVSLQVTDKSAVGMKDPSEVWRERFGRFENEKERGSGGKKQDADRPKDEEEEARPPIKVTGIGDAAYWTGNAQIGALYVKRGNAFVRVSIGGAGELESKIQKSKALARRALSRL